MAARVDESKKKSSHADRMPRDGHTGMGAHTYKHFVEVQQKMNDYIGQQQTYEFDQIQQPYYFPEEHHHRHPRDPAFLDGKRATKQLSSSSTPKRSDKHLANHPLGTPKSNHRHGISSPKPHSAK